MARFLLRSALFLSFAMGLAACGNDDTEPPANTDGGNTEVDAGDDDRDAGTSAPDGGGSKVDASAPASDAGDAGGDTNAVNIVQIGSDIEGEHDKDIFGSSMALSADGTRVIVGAEQNSDVAWLAGHARVFERTGTGWVQLGDDLDADAAEDRYGGAVAISDDGNRIAVGAQGNDNNDSYNSLTGLVRVFDWQGGAWEQVGDDLHGETNEGAGASLAMSASGDRIVVGSDSSGGRDHVTVYELVSGSWTALGDPIASTERDLGTAVAMSDDGKRIALSLLPLTTTSPLPGTVRVYDWKSSAWQQVGDDLVGEFEGSFFGAALSLSGDGSVIAVGATHGNVRVFELVSSQWEQLGDDVDGEPGSAFGTSVGISADGTRLIAGGPDRDFVQVFALEGDAWTAHTIDADDSTRAGQSVAISADGNVAAVGAPYIAGNTSSGVVRVYSLSE